MFRNDVPITPELVRQHGLTPDEYERFRGLIDRDPTLTEYTREVSRHALYRVCDHVDGVAALAKVDVDAIHAGPPTRARTHRATSSGPRPSVATAKWASA